MVNRIASLSYTVDNNHVSKDGCANFEEAIGHCGYGRFHYGFVLLCGVMFLCVGCQNGINAYILPSAECDLKLESAEKGLLNVAFLVGGVISSFFWGVFADAYGRRYVLLITLMIDSIVTIVSSFSQSFGVLVVFRAINGFTIGAPGSLIYTYVGEFHTEKHRAKSICYLGFFWTLSWLILPGLAWIIIPLPISIKYHGILYNSWRLFLALIGIPTFIVTLVCISYPESPKFLAAQGKTEEALRILRKIYAINNGKTEDEYPVKILLSETNSGLQKNDDSSSSGLSPSGLLTELLKNIWRQIRSLASPPLLQYAILCWTIYFTNMFGYYGLGLWLPELFNRFENYHHLHPDKPVMVCELMDDTNILNQTIVTKTPTLNLSSANITDDECLGNTMDEQVFINAVIINIVCLFGNFASGYLANRVTRQVMPVVTMLMAGAFALATYFAKSSLQILIMTCLFSLNIATANIVVGSVVVDIFPTHVGAVAICMMTCFGRIGAIASNLAFGMLLDISCEVPIFLVGAIVIFGGLLGFLIPTNKT